MKVHVLVTHLDGERFDGSLLVFDTIRVGFPTAEIVVWGNDLTPALYNKVMPFRNLPRTSHDSWIESLVTHETEPFWICDTDVVFFEEVENWKFEKPLAGRYEPGFIEPWSKTHKAERLHTSLLFFDVVKLRVEMKAYIKRYHPTNFPFFPDVPLIRQVFVPQGVNKPPIFYDTCAGLYNAIGGQHFDETQNAAFEHLHCGVYANRISVALPGITDVHKRVFADTVNARGLRNSQEAFYERNKIL